MSYILLKYDLIARILIAKGFNLIISCKTSPRIVINVNEAQIILTYQAHMKNEIKDKKMVSGILGR